MYTPKGCLTLDKVKEPQIRLGIQGYGGTGKTWAALTFPNPIVLNLDRGLGAHTGRSDVMEVPLYSTEFCRSIEPQYNPTQLKDFVYRWLDTEGRKLESDQTLIIDGNTGLQNAYHSGFAATPVVGRNGQFDGFAEWKLKLVYYGSILELIKTLRCHIIYICHETDKREKSGDYLGKVRPLLSGQMGDSIMGHFTDWVRQLACDKPKDFTSIKKDSLDNWGCKNPSEFQTLCSQFPRNTMYYWQTESDDVFDGKVSSLVNFPRYIPANYTSFKKYMKQISVSSAQ